MILTKDEFMNYARIEEDDPYVDVLLPIAEAYCMEVARAESEEEFEAMPEAKVAVLYAGEYLYDHRENADFRGLSLSLRALLLSRNHGFRQKGGIYGGSIFKAA